MKTALTDELLNHFAYTDLVSNELVNRAVDELNNCYSLITHLSAELRRLEISSHG